MNPSRNTLPARPLVQKLLLRFQKAGLLRFLSHHDLMSVFARALRRAGLPIRQTAGFNPQMRLSFPAPLEVGVAALADPVELELTEWLTPAETVARLNATLSEGLRILDARLSAPVRAGAMAAWSRYRWAGAFDAGVTAEGVARFQACPAFAVPRVLPPKRGGKELRRKRVELKRSLAAITIAPAGVEWIVRHGEFAVPRVAEMAAALRVCSQAGADAPEVREAEVVPVGDVLRIEVGLQPAVVNCLDADWWKQPVVEPSVEESSQPLEEAS
ncbi:MAG TPA: TIGR03936 family radical SAM-associated protein [Planctomycetota bacterium]|nr:TIGR03936 family radical SAM-associated protein [Planctomycetota bacterium]